MKPTSCDNSKVGVLPEVNPISISTARKLAYAYRDETKKELEKLTEQGFIVALVDVATTWCIPMVVVEKPNGGIRIVWT